MGFANAGWLWLTPLGLLPFLGSLFHNQRYSWSPLIPEDTLSSMINLVVRLLGLMAITMLVMGLAGPYREDFSVTKTGYGANLILLLDRSRSMDDSFAGRSPSGGEESKSQAASRLLEDFVQARPHDRIGVAAFSTSAMYVIPMNNHKESVLSAVRAIRFSGLAQTNIAKGLAMSLSFFEEGQAEGSRGIVLVSDGAAVISRDSEALLRKSFQQWKPRIYWIFLRTEGNPGLFELPPNSEDTPEARPERHLHLFFESLGVPYTAYEAENSDGVGRAISDIDKTEKMPMRYEELHPRDDLQGYCFGFAAFSLLGLVLLLRLETHL